MTAQEMMASTTDEMNDESLPGVNVMLQGESGVGKTHIIGSLVDTGLEVFYLTLDPGRESLAGYFTDKGKKIPENLHWATIRTTPTGFAAMKDISEKINTYNFEMLTKLVDPNKKQYNQHTQLLTMLSEFKDERTKKSFGAVDHWNTDRALVIDNLSGLSDIILNNVVGGKPVKNQGEWGIAQTQVETLLKMLTDGCRCHFILLSHIEKELDEVNGGYKTMASTLGKKLAPKLPKMFSDVILAERNGKEFNWSTAASGVTLKSRNLAFSDKITPGFGQIIQKWESRGGKRMETVLPVKK